MTVHKLKRSIMVYIGGPRYYTTAAKAAENKFDLIIFDSVPSASSFPAPDIHWTVNPHRL